MIKGKYIAMECPLITWSKYKNCNAFFSLVLLTACVAKYKLVSIHTITWKLGG